MTTDVEKQEGQKTVVSFAAGLLIGGLLVWAFSGSPETNEARTIDAQNQDESTMEAGDEAGDTSEGSDDSDMSDNDMDSGSAGEDTAPTMEVGDGSVELGTVSAGSVVMLDGASFPTSEGWVGVRTFTNGEIGSILGVSRYSESQGLIPDRIDLLSPVVAGREYAVVFFAEDGDREFNPAADAQLDTEITTFTAE